MAADWWPWMRIQVEFIPQPTLGRLGPQTNRLFGLGNPWQPPPMEASWRQCGAAQAFTYPPIQGVRGHRTTFPVLILPQSLRRRTEPDWSRSVVPRIRLLSFPPIRASPGVQTAFRNRALGDQGLHQRMATSWWQWPPAAASGLRNVSQHRS